MRIKLGLFAPSLNHVATSLLPEGFDGCNSSEFLGTVSLDDYFLSSCLFTILNGYRGYTWQR
ncbi:MAG: hypothetical protein AAF357_15915 [Verrucomicrobiota bacterium]